MTGRQGFSFGQFHSGDSMLHRLDARGKLLLLPMLIVVTFSASPLSLLLLSLIGIILAETSGLGIISLLRGLRPIRWLLLATLLLHLFFTPGRTLGPFSWLSYDGLLLGAQNSSQLLLAMLFATLLSLTTTPDDLAAAIGSLFHPFRFLGVPSERLAELLGLTLQFVPLLREEGQELWKSSSSSLSALKRGPLIDRAHAAANFVEPLVLRLADRAEQMALRMACGEVLVARPLLPPMTWVLRLQILLACLVLLGWCWL